MQNFFKNSRSKKIKRNQGVLLVEVMVVASIITVAFIAILTVTSKASSVSRQALHTTQANFLLEEGAEVARMLRDNDWSNISSLVVGTDYYPTYSAGVWSLSVTPNTVGGFTRKVNIASVTRDSTSSDIASSGVVDEGTKLVTVTVTWLEGSNTVSKTLSFYLMDIFS